MTPAQPVTTFWRLAGMSYLQVRNFGMDAFLSLWINGKHPWILGANEPIHSSHYFFFLPQSLLVRESRFECRAWCLERTGSYQGHGTRTIPLQRFRLGEWYPRRQNGHSILESGRGNQINIHFLNIKNWRSGSVHGFGMINLWTVGSFTNRIPPCGIDTFTTTKK